MSLFDLIWFDLLFRATCIAAIYCDQLEPIGIHAPFFLIDFIIYLFMYCLCLQIDNSMRPAGSHEASCSGVMKPINQAEMDRKGRQSRTLVTILQAYYCWLEEMISSESHAN